MYLISTVRPPRVVFQPSAHMMRANTTRRRAARKYEPWDKRYGRAPVRFVRLFNGTRLVNTYALDGEV